MRALVPLLLVSLASAQQAESPAPFGHSRHGAELDEGPRQAAYLMPGMNDQVHFPVHGLCELAQRFFDQGIVQQHGFWYFEAERSFRQVAMLHPDCALAYWGMAMANVENVARAAGFAAMAVQRSAGLPEREKAYVDAIAALYQIDDPLRAELTSGDDERVKNAKATVAGKQDRDEKRLRREFVRGLEAVVASCPDDVEAKAFLAIQCWHNTEHGIEISSYGAVDALLAAVLAKTERHPAHHYRVHLWDHEKPERALASAAALGDSAPGIAHQWHMAGHIYADLNRHGEAAWQQQASGRVDHAHMARDRVMPFLIHNYGHNQEWLARSWSYVGRADDALAAVKNLAEVPRHPKHNQLDDGQHIAGYARRRLVSVCEDYELWTRAVQLAASGHLDATDSVPAEVQRLGLLGRAFFRLGRVDDAQRVAAETERLLLVARGRRAAAVDKAEDDAFASKVPPDKRKEAMAEAGRMPTDSVQAVLDLQRELKGEELLSKGDAKGALAEFEAVKDFPKTLLADAMVAAGQPEKAVELLDQEVKAHPHRVPTLGRLFLALCAVHDVSGKPEDKQRLRDMMMELPATRDGELPKTPFEDRIGIGVSACGWPSRPSERSGFGDDFGPRPELASLGPARWTPFPHAGFDLPAADGTRVSLAAHPGKPTLVVFYLGFSCLLCVEQLHALRKQHQAFVDAGIDVVAIGDQDVDTVRSSLAALPGDQRLPFALLADPQLTAFKSWRCFDDFERMPLHGTFLIDTRGDVRWQDVSATPFAQFDWLLHEARRLLALSAPAAER